MVSVPGRGAALKTAARILFARTFAASQSARVSESVVGIVGQRPLGGVAPVQSVIQPMRTIPGSRCSMGKRRPAPLRCVTRLPPRYPEQA